MIPNLKISEIILKLIVIFSTFTLYIYCNTNYSNSASTINFITLLRNLSGLNQSSASGNTGTGTSNGTSTASSVSTSTSTSSTSSNTSTASVNTSIPTVTIQNLKNNNSAFTGFMIGTASDGTGVSKVEVSYDSGAYTTATGTSSWKMALPNGSATWLDGTKHTISVRAQNTFGNYSAITTITVMKARNHDINGDGYSDMVASAETAAPGIGYIFYSNGTSGINATSPSSANQIITGEGTTTFGDIITMGDLNGDGYADVVASDISYSSSKGRVYIFYSQGTSGILSSITLAASASKILTGINANDNYGVGIDITDMNNDGYSDLIVSDYAAPTSNKGTVRIYFSAGSSGITAASASSTSNLIAGITASEYFGNIIGTADFNGDGNIDLIACTYFFPTTSKGQCKIFHGSTSGITATLSSGATTTISGTTNNLSYGITIATGDLNGDGYSDLAVGANQFTPTNTGNGKVYVYLSNASGVNTTAIATYTGENLNDRLGDGLLIVDLNADGKKDLVMGAGYYPSGGQDGRAYIFNGNSSGVNAVAVTSADLIISSVPSTGGKFASQFSASDLNGDGWIDLFINAYVFGTLSDGAVYIFHTGGTSGISTSSTTGATRSIIATPSSNNTFGWSLY